MLYTTLGKTNLKVSRIGFGAWGIGGGAKNLKWEGMWKADDSTSKATLSKAYKNGINFYDTALEYGNGHSERLIKEVLNKNGIVIATKVPPKDMHWPAIDDDINNVFPKDYIIQKAKESYKNLGRTIDILQLHVWSDRWFDNDGWRDAFQVLRKEGIARFFGVSINDHNPDSAMKLVKSGEIDTIQVIYNIFDQSPRDKLFPLAKKKNVGIIARVPLDEGSLSGTFTYNTTFNDFRKDYFAKDRLKITVDKVNKIKDKLVNQKRATAQIALKFCLLDGGADVAIVGMRNPNRVEENVKSVDIEFTDEEIKFLESQRWIRNFYPEDV
ncbi:MAG: aldo/keto reductase [Candidatus Aenigmarchaeota archaeon]|nr:aldo/keto reductase [Candidatus Aenigmarchaeota archaeon]